MEEGSDQATSTSPLALQVLAGTEDDLISSQEPDLGAEIRRLESEMNKLKEKLRLTTLTLYTAEKERDEALAQLAQMMTTNAASGPERPQSPPASDQKMKLSAQLESLAMALHAASAEAEANDMELQLERQRRLAAKSIADDLIRRLSSATDVAMKEGAVAEAALDWNIPGAKNGELRSPRRVKKSERKTSNRANAETVDRAIEHLKQRFQQMNVTIPITREDDFIYRLGRDRLYIQIIQGKLMLRQSGRYVDLLQWLESRY